MNLIPHQLGVSKPQLKKLLKGLVIQLAHEKLGSGAGDTILHLAPDNAKRLLSAYKRVKGLRMKLTPEEIEHTLQKLGGEKEGGKISRSKKAKKWEQFSVDTLGDALNLGAKAKSMFGYGVSRSKKAKKWEDFSVNTVNDALNLGAKAKSMFGGKINRMKKAKKWTQYSVDTLGDALNLGAKAKSMFGYGVKSNIADRMAKLRAMRRPIGSNPATYAPRISGGEGLYGYPSGAGLYGNGLNGGVNVIKRRGRPPKSGLGIATQTKVYRTAMRLNKGGLEIDAPIINNSSKAK